MGSHLIDGQFQSDKYPTTPRGKVPLSTKDPAAQDLLWTYAQRRRAVDAEFSDDLEQALLLNDYQDRPLAPGDVVQLKSGGPDMTIAEKVVTSACEPGRDGWRCEWFDGGRHEQRVFPPAMLRRVEPSAAPVAASAEPDAWEPARAWGSDRPKNADPTPSGYNAVGPWMPIAIAGDGDSTVTLWRRPLRKVSP